MNWLDLKDGPRNLNQWKALFWTFTLKTMRQIGFSLATALVSTKY